MREGRGSGLIPGQQAHKVFMDRTRAQVDAMVRRLAPKYRKVRGQLRLITPGRDLPFTLSEYRDWFGAQLGGQEQGSGFCTYCRRPINATTLVPDHYVPLDRGGGPELANLRAACKPCNDLKGKLLPKPFLALVQFLEQFPETDRNEVTQRLRTAYQLAAARQWSARKNAQRSATSPCPTGKTATTPTNATIQQLRLTPQILEEDF